MDPSPVSSQALPPGTRIEEFVIERVLGSGGFGITYLARDARLGRQVVIKENLPVQFCFRDTHSLTVAPRHSHGDDAENFKWSLENFSKESAMLASLDHPGIVKVLRSFEAFGTAYFVMPYVDGMALDTLVEDRRGKNKPFAEDELRGLLERVLGALAHLHDRGIYHRDIKPGNLLITNEGIPVLIDFGSARQRLSERSMTVVESAGYTPFEQLQSRGNVGPWSDLYALGGTLVKLMTGEAPPKANDRVRKDPFTPMVERGELVSRFSKDFLRSLDRSLAVDEEDRWQDAGEWLSALRGGDVVESKPTVAPRVGSDPVAPESSRRKTKPLPWIIAACVILGLGAWTMNKSRRADEAEMERPKPIAHAKEEAEAKAEIEKRLLTGSKAGEERDFEISPGVKITMCWIPPGEFLMGSPEDEIGRESDEKQVKVTLSKGFWLAKTEVTQGQWKAVGGIDVSGRPPAFWDEKVQFTWEQFSALGVREVNFKGVNLPVERVNWDEVRDWCLGMTERLRNDGQLSGDWKLVLPTEAQWEYACRAGATTALHSGRNLNSKEAACGNLGEVGWYDKNSGNRTQPVAQKKANAWGLHDMHGNVLEWCADWYGEGLGGGVDPQGAATGVSRAFRGGSWDSTASRCRAADRFRFLPVIRNINLGFRPALVPSEKQDK